MMSAISVSNKEGIQNTWILFLKIQSSWKCKIIIAIFFRIQRLISMAEGKGDNSNSGLSSLALGLPQLIEIFKDSMHLSGQGKNEVKIQKEFENYFKTGNCGLLGGNELCINPMLLDTSNHWFFNLLGSPYGGYVPIPYDEVLDCGGESPQCPLFHHCQAILKEHLIKFRARKKSVSLSFYVGESLELCMLNQDWKNRFTVIHCSDLADAVGLANLLAAATNCLTEDPTALILTETTWLIKLAFSIVEYIQTSLGCPISFIPTIYGLRLVDHVHLGSSVPLHTCGNSPELINFTWQRVNSYSTNILLGVSSDFKKIFDNLRQMCFIETTFLAGKTGPLTSACTPMTYYYIVHSLANRCGWNEDTFRFLLKPTIPVPFQLTWQTQENWMNGNKVSLYQKTSSFSLLLMLPDLRALPWRLVVVPAHEASKWAILGMTEVILNEGARDNFFVDTKGLHYIDNFHVQLDNHPGKEDISVSFLLALDHGLSESDCVFAFNFMSAMQIMSFGPLGQFKKTVTNQYPVPINARLRPLPSLTNGLQVSSCLEFEDRYEISFIFEGKEFQPVNSKYYYSAKSYFFTTLSVTFLVGSKTGGFARLLDDTYPAESAHSLALSAPGINGTLIIQVPWPFTILGSTRNFDTSKLIMDKIRLEPWPHEFRGRSKWDIDRLERWDDVTRPLGHNLSNHLSAQWYFVEDGSNPYNRTPISPLEEIRQVIGAVFSQVFHHQDLWFSVSKRTDTKPSNNFLLRAHLPMRVSPTRVPLLLVSVMDRKMDGVVPDIDKPGKFKEMDLDFKKVLNYGVGDSFINLIFDTDEGIALFRYLLRVNSTKMRRTAWQSKRLPRNSHWLPTFLSPVYPSDFKTDFENPGNGFASSCLHCQSVKMEMKRCSRCKIALYCDTNCQKADWRRHKHICRSGQ